MAGEVGSEVLLVVAGGNMTDMKSQPLGLLSQDDPFGQFWSHFSLLPTLTLTSNMFYGQYKRPSHFYFFKLLTVSHSRASFFNPHSLLLQIEVQS